MGLCKTACLRADWKSLLMSHEGFFCFFPVSVPYWYGAIVSFDT